MSRSTGLWLAVFGILFAIYFLLPFVLLQRAPSLDVEQVRKEYERRRALEYTTLEVADWFGRTGLDEETEREVPRYLRRELGEFVDDPNGLKASELTYVGAFSEGGITVHYWRIPSGAKEVYAYVEVGPSGGNGLGWGGKSPPTPGVGVH